MKIKKVNLSILTKFSTFIEYNRKENDKGVYKTLV